MTTRGTREKWILAKMILSVRHLPVTVTILEAINLDIGKVFDGSKFCRF